MEKASFDVSQIGVPPKYVTIATDASYDYGSKMAVWACYIRTPERAYKTAQLFKGPIASSSQAETLALANALRIADQLCDLTKHHLIVYSDCAGVIGVEHTKAGNVRKRAAQRAQLIAEHITVYLGKAQWYEIRHVKAHTSRWDKQHPKHEAKYFMNHWCDINSRAVLRKARSEMNKPKTAEVK